MSKLGIIGGSGLYQIEGLEKVETRQVKTPFGSPSDDYIEGALNGKPVVFLPRHGRGHRLLPTEINFRANIYGLKSLGVTRILSVGAVGSLKEEVRPLDMLIPDQFIDLTKRRVSTFFGEGLAAHVGFADPLCPELGSLLYEASISAGCRTHKGGTYLCIEGPQFSSRAESRLYRSWNADIIGMTNVTEAKLAREAEMCYATLALVTDYDVWPESEEEVTADMIIANLQKNVEAAKQIIRQTAANLPADTDCSCNQALQTSLITDPGSIPAAAKEKLNLIAGKYLK